MRIAIIGNCQVVGLAQAVRGLVPSAEVEPIFLAKYSQAELLEKAAAVEKYEVVFSQVIGPASPFFMEKIKPTVRRLHLIPTVLFTGFHPDTFLIQGHKSAAGNYHSSIVAAAYLLQLSARRAAALFNAFVYSKLGYFQVYGNAKAFFLQEAKKFGYDLASELGDWERQGIFMHSINHPNMMVLACLAHKMVVQHQLGSASIPIAVPDHDYMAAGGIIYPVYPEIAQKLNVPGSMLFRRPDRTLNLEEFVVESYEIYEKTERQLLQRGASDSAEKIKALLV